MDHPPFVDDVLMYTVGNPARIFGIEFFGIASYITVLGSMSFFPGVWFARVGEVDISTSVRWSWEFDSSRFGDVRMTLWVRPGAHPKTCWTCWILIFHPGNPGFDSMDWFKGTFTGKPHIYWENLWFPVDFQLNQSIDWLPEGTSQEMHLHHSPRGEVKGWEPSHLDSLAGQAANTVALVFKVEGFWGFSRWDKYVMCLSVSFHGLV